MTFELDGERTDLAREFKAQPYGSHSAELAAALAALRGADPEGKLILVCTQRGLEWPVAHLEGDPPRAILHRDLIFSSIEQAQWAVFKRRWKALTGVEPDVD